TRPSGGSPVALVEQLVPVMEDLRGLYEAAVNRSKELEAQNADLSASVAHLEEMAAADGQENPQRVGRQGKRLRDMVEQLLQASAFVANRSPVLRAEEVMAAEVVSEVVDDWRMAEPARGVELLLPSQPRSIHGDAEALRMVVGNLVDNAGRRGGQGRPRAHLRP